jgi:hopene-associated glycosyltransferase HpnB
VLALTVLAFLSAATWLYLLVAHGRYWVADQRIPADCGDAAPDDGWPTVVAVVPARDEASVLPVSLPSLLGQDYPGEFSVLLVDDASSDGTADVAEKIAGAQIAAGRDGAGRERGLTIVRSDGPPAGWVGKVAAMNRGVKAIADVESGRVEGAEGAASGYTVAGGGTDAVSVLSSGGSAVSQPTYLLFTDADIAHSADSVRRLVGFAERHDADLVSLMALLRTETTAERAIVPAFVYSFAQLYPFPRVNRNRSRTAAAAGGCMLVRRSALASAGGLERIAGARIDDVALGQLIKRHARNGRRRIWLGLTRDVRSVRPYPELRDLWDMVARSAYTQLRYSPVLLIGTLLGLLVMYGVPPIVGLTCLAVALNGGGSFAAVGAAAALAAWAMMWGSYLPTLRLYGLRWWRGAALPAVMMLYGAMTFDSARRHYRGRGGTWKGRTADDH